MAHLYTATVRWTAEGDFASGQYSRGHDWMFDGGVTVPGSSSPAVVPPPLSREDAVDPEEALVAALASCHMLWFLNLAQRAGFVVEAYEDHAHASMARLEAKRWWVDKVTLRPRATFAAGAAPDPARLAALHEEAHRLCYIANSVRSEVTVEPVTD
ncbi:organic hydroperoxide reductase OsmC/OhrA [Tepidamorphus gemmatus]|jgi:organic hydroperoxide reductase OsmC/OhrA|uniref:Organic hydroperoxide reductase OsmC/OhrA n=1 Tax=Tepidamorphus gemmatus TaxID=747076 RepID=A0A4R3MF14_9HYPH|nr:OsmC family protein [Tepidamorphus gemmatus]TCT12096.1 organic hydroperoxide reductase OsmC/OhrA [Tepidamorphus gemmatus]